MNVKDTAVDMLNENTSLQYFWDLWDTSFCLGYFGIFGKYLWDTSLCLLLIKKVLQENASEESKDLTYHVTSRSPTCGTEVGL